MPMNSVTLESPAAVETPAPAPQAQLTTPRDSAALRRLMDEVRFQDTNPGSASAAYDRAHNRHNR
jgi:hypothetical protein